MKVSSFVKFCFGLWFWACWCRVLFVNSFQPDQSVLCKISLEIPCLLLFAWQYFPVESSSVFLTSPFHSWAVVFMLRCPLFTIFDWLAFPCPVYSTPFPIHQKIKPKVQDSSKSELLMSIPPNWLFRFLYFLSSHVPNRIKWKLNKPWDWAECLQSAY